MLTLTKALLIWLRKPGPMLTLTKALLIWLRPLTYQPHRAGTSRPGEIQAARACQRRYVSVAKADVTTGEAPWTDWRAR
jgi:hypothetical protein